MSLDFELLVPLLTIISIDIVLGGDNAVVVALACRNLPSNVRNKAIMLGIGFAIVARIILTLLAVYLLNIPFLMAIGGGLLLYISYHLLTDADGNRDVQAQTTVFAAIKTIILADVIMGFDNVIAVAGAAHGNTVLVVIGLLISVPIIIWGSKIILYAIERFPIIVYFGSGILVYTATKMIIHEQVLATIFLNYPILSPILQFTAIIVVLLLGWFSNRIKKGNLNLNL